MLPLTRDRGDERSWYSRSPVELNCINRSKSAAERRSKPRNSNPPYIHIPALIHARFSAAHEQRSRLGIAGRTIGIKWLFCGSRRSNDYGETLTRLRLTASICKVGFLRLMGASCP